MKQKGGIIFGMPLWLFIILIVLVLAGVGVGIAAAVGAFNKPDLCKKYNDILNRGFYNILGGGRDGGTEAQFKKEIQNMFIQNPSAVSRVWNCIFKKFAEVMGELGGGSTQLKFHEILEQRVGANKNEVEESESRFTNPNNNARIYAGKVIDIMKKIIENTKK